MDLRSKYLGLELKNPLVPSASPISRKLDGLRALEDAGAPAVVLYSLFEEQIEFDSMEMEHFLEYGSESYAESVNYFPEPTEFTRGPEEYLEHIRKAKDALDIPVIASLNGASPGGWIDYGRRIQEAGADALELNIYFLPTDPQTPVGEIEETYIDIVSEICRSVELAIAVKMHPYFSSIPSMARRLVEAGAQGLALFNRFYEPDIRPEELEISSEIELSSGYESRMALRWIGILYHRVRAELAATSGIYSGRDAIKMLMAGAQVTHLCSALLHHGMAHLRRVQEEMLRWMEENEYSSVSELIGSMSQKSCPDPTAFERANYIRVLNDYK